MDLKAIELVLVAGGLWLLWRSANRLGAEARAARESETDGAAPSDAERAAPQSRES
jgi:hypothetical protein